MTLDEKIVEAVARAIHGAIKVDASGLAPAVIGHYVTGFDEAARAAITAYQAEAVAEAAAAIQAFEAIGWKDISEAPTDGTRVMVWNSMTGAYSSEFSQGQWPLRLWDGVRGDWYPVPTHWRPLPEPPASKASP